MAGKGVSAWHLVGVSPFEVSDIVADAEDDNAETLASLGHPGLHIHAFHEILGRVADVCFPEQLNS